MSKELEAPFGTPMEELRFLQKLEPVGTAFWHRFEYIAKALTPPTADEVCKALSEYYNIKVYYDSVKKSFEVGKYDPSICYKDDELIWFNWFRIPPHLITLIGRFYEVQE